jgi:hypothetical protein
MRSFLLDFRFIPNFAALNIVHLSAVDSFTAIGGDCRLPEGNLNS